MITLYASVSLLAMIANSVDPITDPMVTCTGTKDPPFAVPYCYSGTKFLVETVTVQVNSFSSETGVFDFTVNGLKKIDCQNQSFTKSGQTLHANLSTCVDSPQSISSIDYCSDQDKLLVNFKLGPLPFAVPLTKVLCPSEKKCTGNKDPPWASPFCYSRVQPGRETVNLKVSSFVAEQGSFDVTGDGLEKIDCKNVPFTKSGQTLQANMSSCVHPPLSITSLEYCSDQDHVLVNSKVGPVEVHVPLKKVACPSMDIESALMV